MNRYFLTLTWFILVLNANAQIVMADSATTTKTTIGKAKRGGVTIAELYYIGGGDIDTTYVIMYSNAKYTTISDYNSILFNGGEDVLNQLYGVIKSVYAEENKKNKEYKKQFMLGKDDVIVSNYRMMGTTSAMIWTDGGYFYLTEKELDKLFGK